VAAPDLKTLGRYNIERVLGKGAMGVVYEGFDPRLNRRVAIKTILKSHLDDSTAKDYSMRFVREAQAVARLNHPNIVQVHDFGEEGDIAYLVMEFIRGKELKTLFDANERFDLKEVVRIMGELCDALDFAHTAGIIHRDIKPGNVMLDAQMRTKLTDFGVARVQDVTRSQATGGGTMVGTPAYMSPEQITGGSIDRRTDVFSAGIILYQFLTGDMPFSGGGAWTIAKKIMQDQPPLPSSINTSVTPLFDAVVNKALAKDPAQRYQSARGLGIGLKRALEGKVDEDESDKTIVRTPAPAPKPTAPADKAAATQSGVQDAEVEFWRSIKDGNDPSEFEFYLRKFPNGIYAELAGHKIAKLRGGAPEEIGLRAKQPEEQKRRDAEAAARREAEVKAKFEAEDRVAREVERKAKAEAEERAQRDAKAKARMAAEAEARRGAEAGAERDTEQKKRAIAVPAKKRGAPVMTLLIGSVIAVVGGGVWFAMNQSSRTPPAAKLAETQPNQARPAIEQAAKPSALEQKAADEKALAEKAAQDKAAADLAVEKAAVEKAAQEKAAAEKVAAAKLAADKAAAERAVAEQKAAEKAAADKGAAAKLAADRAAKERSAADKAEAAKLAAERAASLPTQIPAAPGPTQPQRPKVIEETLILIDPTVTFPSKPQPASPPSQVASSAPSRVVSPPGAPGTSFRDCDVCPEMIVIPAGSFIMGSPASEPQRFSNEGPQHQVTIARSFAAGKHEVTFDEWDACVREGGCIYKTTRKLLDILRALPEAAEPGDSGWGRGRLPVINVSWNDAKQYVAWLSRKTGKSYRLLSEAEWEYVARAGTTTAFSFGNSITPQQANYNAAQSYAGSPTGVRRDKTVSVGSYPPNAFGLHDVHGNVQEWVEDCKNPTYNGAPSDGSAWTTGDCARRVIRGGSWVSDPLVARSARRGDFPTSRQNRDSGLRVARTN